MCTPPRGLRGWGCPRRAAGPSVPLSADTVSLSPPPHETASVAGGGGWGPACGEERRGFELAPRPRASVVGVSPLESFLAPQAASGWRWPLGVVGGFGDGLAPRGGGAGGPRWVVWGAWGRVFGPPSFHRPALGGRCLPAPGRPRAPPAPRLCGAFLPRRASAVRARFPPTPPTPPWLSPRRDGRLAPEAESVCASAPRGRVPRRRPAGRRGVCPPLRALPPGCGRAAVRAPEPPLREGVAWGGGGGGRGSGVRAARLSPVWASASVRAPAPRPPSPVHLCGAPAPSVP